jgi:hypothetical protein
VKGRDHRSVGPSKHIAKVSTSFKDKVEAPIADRGLIADFIFKSYILRHVSIIAIDIFV